MKETESVQTMSQRYRICVWAIFLSGVGYLIYLNGGGFRAATALYTPASLLLWTALIAMAAMSPIPLPRGTTTIFLTPALDVAAIVLFGPAIACWIGALSRLIANVAERKSPLLLLARVGRSIWALGFGGVAYVAFGGRVGTELTSDQFFPFLGACGAYLLVRGALGAADAAFSAARATGQAGTRYVRERIPVDLVVLPFGFLLALVQVRVGAPGMVVFLVPLLLARYFFLHWVETRRAHLKMVRILMSAVDGADPHTWGHSYRISKMCLRVGKRLGLRERDLEELEFGALVHDIGRTAIRRDILIKTGKLTEQERATLRTHPDIGYEILSGLHFFEVAAEIVRCHHEQPDGKGYPRGLTGDAIPMGSRIIMAVAAFDAMTSDRPYRRGLSPEAALEELNSLGGKQFFSDVVKGLVELYNDGSLFDEFDEAHLEPYRNGEGNSRAVDEWLKGPNARARVPEKRGVGDGPGDGVTVSTSGDGKASSESGAPMIEFPIGEVSRRADGRVMTLKAKGGWKLTAAGISDVGCRRSNNEDAFGIFEYEDSTRGCLLILADGMGGAKAGEIASRLAVDTVRSGYEGKKTGLSARDALEHAVENANRVIHDRSRTDKDLEGMGTTCTAASIVGRDLTIAHVGDSRAYLVKGGSIQTLTEDHTLAAELAGLGSSKGAAARSSNQLTRSLGTQETVAVDVPPHAVRLEDGSTLVLCSDGLSNMVEPGEILDVVRQESPEEACRTLVELARARGGPDNITVVVANIRRS